MELVDVAVPVVKPVRTIPFALENKSKECLIIMESAKIIIRVGEASEWVNSFVIVRKNNNSVRICLDPQELNNVIKSHSYKLPTLDDIMTKLSGSKFFSTLDAASGLWNIPLDE